MKKDELASRDYPVQEDMRWQRRESVIQRIGEYVLMVIVIWCLRAVFQRHIK